MGPDVRLRSTVVELIKFAVRIKLGIRELVEKGLEWRRRKRRCWGQEKRIR